MKMGMDIRWPIALLFGVYGTTLIVEGMLAPPFVFQKSLNMNIDLGWGVAMLVFGFLMGVPVPRLGPE
jgi:hypothetical protein